MRSITAAEQAILSKKFARSTHVRVFVRERAGNTLVDLTDLFGWDFLRSVDVGEDVDGPGLTATLEFSRAVYENNLSPHMVGSRANNWSGQAKTLLELNAYVKVEVAIGPEGSAPSTWNLLFEGYVDRTKTGDEVVVVECSDPHVKIKKAFIRKERVYGFLAGYTGTKKGLLIWGASTAFAVGDLVLPGTLNDRFYRCDIAGTTSALEPAWPTVVGSTVTSGTARFVCEGTTASGELVEEVAQQIINDNVPNPPTVYAPVASSFYIQKYDQDRGPTLEAVRNMALNGTGSDFRYRWDNATSSFRFTYVIPERTKTTPDATFSPDDYFTVEQLERDIDGIRNDVRVIFTSATEFESDGKTSKRIVRELRDDASIAKYDALFMEIAEAPASQIDSTAEADALLQSLLSDCSEPKAAVEVPAPLYPWVQLGDLYRLTPNGVHIDTNLDVAVAGYRHTITQESARTTFTCRGKPSGGYVRWHETASGPKQDTEVHKLIVSDGGASITTSVAPGGAKLILQRQQERNTIVDVVEYHVSTAPGFTPGPSTLAAVTKSDEVTFSHLTSGQTYYAKAVQHFLNAGQPVVAPPTAEISFVAGHVQTAHLADSAVVEAKLAALAVTAGKIADGAVTDVKISGVDAAKLTGTAPETVIPTLAKAKIDPAGTWTEAEIPALTAAKIPVLAKAKIDPAGTWAATEIPALDAAKITTGTFGAARIGVDAIQAANIAVSQIQPHHLAPDFDAAMPRNGNFEVGNNNDGAPVNWSSLTGVYGTEWVLDANGIANDGAQSVKFLAAAQAQILSDLCTIRPSEVYSLECAVRPEAPFPDAARVVILGVRWYTTAKVLISTSSVTLDLNTLAKDVWHQRRSQFTAPADAAYAAVLIGEESLDTDFIWYLDSVRLTTVGDKWHEVGAAGEPAFQNGWINFDAANWTTAAFMRDEKGRVYLRGLVKSGTVGAVPVFTLPVGYRPAKSDVFAALSNNAIGRITVGADGQVMAEIGSNAWFGISTVNFMAGL